VLSLLISTAAQQSHIIGVLSVVYPVVLIALIRMFGAL
jgi:hypothetical protein